MEYDDNIGIGGRIGALMKERGLNQKELAEAVGVTTAAMSRYLSGGREPKIDTVARLAKALHTTTDYLICGVVQKSAFDDIHTMVVNSANQLNDEEVLRLIKALLHNTK